MFTCKIEFSIVLHLIKLLVNETKWSSLLARNRTPFLDILIWILDFGPEKLLGLSRNGPLDPGFQRLDNAIHALDNFLAHWYVQWIREINSIIIVLFTFWATRIPIIHIIAKFKTKSNQEDPNRIFQYPLTLCQCYVAPYWCTKTLKWWPYVDTM